MKFISKIDWWFYLLLLLVFLGVLLLFGSNALLALPWLSTLAVLLVAVLALVLLPAAVSTWYEVGKSGITVHCGLLVNLQIPYLDIISVTPSRTPALAPALSLDRLEIQYYKLNGRGMIYLSPQNQKAFLEELNLRMYGR